MPKVQVGDRVQILAGMTGLGTWYPPYEGKTGVVVNVSGHNVNIRFDHTDKGQELGWTDSWYVVTMQKDRKNRAWEEFCGLHD